MSRRVHAFIPDTQVKPGINTDYCEWVGRYLADYKPDVIVHAGDHWDMPSLSSYDRGRRKAEGRRYWEDVEAGNAAMERLLHPIRKRRGYNPEMHFCLGNHEERIERHTEASPELHGTLGYHNLDLRDWRTHDFLKPRMIDGVAYVHYVCNPMTGKPYGGQASTVLKNVGHSFVMGHRQVLEVATRQNPFTGRQQWGIIAGACYPHEEDYKGPQGNRHWRGMVILHEVSQGHFDPMFVSLDYLKRRYGGK